MGRASTYITTVTTTKVSGKTIGRMAMEFTTTKKGMKTTKVNGRMELSRVRAFIGGRMVTSMKEDSLRTSRAEVEWPPS